MKSRYLLLAAVAAVTLAGCRMSNQPQDNATGTSTAAASTEWAKFMSGYIEQTFRANPPFGATAGRHEYDGQLPDWTEAGITSEKTRLKSAIAAAEKFDPASLSENERFERAYLIAQAKGSLFFIDAADQPHKNPAYYNGSLDPSTYVVVPYAAPEVRMKAYTRYLEAVPLAAKQIQANLRTPLPLSFVNYGKNAFGGYAEYYPGDGLKAFAGIGNAQEQGALKTASTNAAAAMRSLADWLELQRPKANSDFALGAAKFQQMLYDTEMVDTPIAELERIGRADLDSNLKLLNEAWGRPLGRRNDDHAMHGEDERQQARRRTRGRRPGAAGGPQAVHPRQGSGDDPRDGRGEGGRSASL